MLLFLRYKHFPDFVKELVMNEMKKRKREELCSDYLT